MGRQFFYILLLLCFVFVNNFIFSCTAPIKTTSSKPPSISKSDGTDFAIPSQEYFLRKRESGRSGGNEKSTEQPPAAVPESDMYTWKILAVAAIIYFALMIVIFVITHLMLQRLQKHARESMKTAKSSKLKEAKPGSSIGLNKSKESAIVVTCGSGYSNAESDKPVIMPEAMLSNGKKPEKAKSEKIRSTRGTTAREKEKRKRERLWTEQEEKTQEALTISVRDSEADRVDTAAVLSGGQPSDGSTSSGTSSSGTYSTSSNRITSASSSGSGSSIGSSSGSRSSSSSSGSSRSTTGSGSSSSASGEGSGSRTSSESRSTMSSSFSTTTGSRSSTSTLA